MVQDNQRQEAVDWVRKGVAALRQKDFQLARRCLLMAKDLDPENADAWFYLTATTRDLERRRRLLWKVLTIDPDHQQARRGLAEIERLQTVQGGSLTLDSGEKHCPDCGAVLRPHARTGRPVCVFCGYGSREETRTAPRVVRVYPAQAWPAEMKPRHCLKCNAISILPVEMPRETPCPVCMHDVLEPDGKPAPVPDVLVPFQVDEAHAAVALEDVKLEGGWRRGGLRSRRMTRPRPLLLPAWLFTGVGHVRFTSDGAGYELEHGFERLLISGSRQFDPALWRIASNVPFEGAERCDPAMIASDRQVFTVLSSLTCQAAFQEAQGIIGQVMRRRVAEAVQDTGQEINIEEITPRNFVVRQVLLPVWVNEQRQGTHVFMGLVNGVTGHAVAGPAPRLGRS